MARKDAARSDVEDGETPSADSGSRRRTDGRKKGAKKTASGDWKTADKNTGAASADKLRASAKEPTQAESEGKEKLDLDPAPNSNGLPEVHVEPHLLVHVASSSTRRHQIIFYEQRSWVGQEMRLLKENLEVNVVLIIQR